MKIRVKTIVTCILLVITVNAYSQEFLSLKKSQIKERIKLQGGRIAYESSGDQIVLKSLNVIWFKYKASSAIKNGIIGSTFLLQNDKCYHYANIYGSSKYLESIIKSFDAPGSEFKRSGEELVWKNRKDVIIKIKMQTINKIHGIFTVDIDQSSKGASTNLHSNYNKDSLQKAMMKKWAPAFSKDRKS